MKLQPKVSLTHCQSCYCMTHMIKGKCGKCGEIKTKQKELEEELEARLQIIPHSDDRRKMRGIIQRIRTMDHVTLLQQVGERIKENKVDIRPEITEWITHKTRGEAEAHNEALEQLFSDIRRGKI